MTLGDGSTSRTERPGIDAQVVCYDALAPEDPAVDRPVEKLRLAGRPLDRQRLRPTAIKIQRGPPSVVLDDLRELRPRQPFAVSRLPTVDDKEQ
jgi:hypothetical protein